MEKVNSTFQKYRETARHLRNVAYTPTVEHDYEIIESFEEVCVLLFTHLVVDMLGIERSKCNWLAEPAKCFELVSSADILPIMINRDGQSGYWDNPIKAVNRGELTLNFMDYFDWNSMDQIDFRYYRARITDSNKYPQLVGYDVLIETIYADIYYKIC